MTPPLDHSPSWNTPIAPSSRSYTGNIQNVKVSGNVVKFASGTEFASIGISNTPLFALLLPGFPVCSACSRSESKRSPTRTGPSPLLSDKSPVQMDRWCCVAQGQARGHKNDSNERAHPVRTLSTI